MPRIVADDRECASGVPDLLREMHDVEVVVERLRMGEGFGSVVDLNPDKNSLFA
jgi:hypothetical protein